MSVAILVDSAASLPPGLVERQGIVVVPMTVVLGGAARPDTEVSTDELLAHLATEVVTTTAPNPGEWMSAVELALQRADEAVVLTVSAEMSSAFTSASVAASIVGDRVRVIDTRSAAGGEGLVAVAASRAAEQGASAAEIAVRVATVIERVHLVATLDDLDHLARSGRVPELVGVAGRALHVNPLFEFRDGVAHSRHPALGRRAAEQRIVQACLTSRPHDAATATLHVAALEAACPDRARSLLDAVLAEVPEAEAFTGSFGPVMLVHVGPGLVGLAWWWET